jgi:hypothetical protein
MCKEKEREKMGGGKNTTRKHNYKKNIQKRERD